MKQFLCSIPDQNLVMSGQMSTLPDILSARFCSSYNVHYVAKLVHLFGRSDAKSILINLTHFIQILI